MLYNCWPDISITYRRIICTTLIMKSNKYINKIVEAIELTLALSSLSEPIGLLSRIGKA
jgi:hypothetical protein